MTGPRVVTSAEVAQVRPILLRDRDAAKLVARSPSWIRALRERDRRAVAAGAEPSGPKWIIIGSSVFYRLRDLEEWIEAHAVERGVIAFGNRGGVK